MKRFMWFHSLKEFHWQLSTLPVTTVEKMTHYCIASELYKKIVKITRKMGRLVRKKIYNKQMTNCLNAVQSMTATVIIGKFSSLLNILVRLSNTAMSVFATSISHKAKSAMARRLPSSTQHKTSGTHLTSSACSMSAERLKHSVMWVVGHTSRHAICQLLHNPTT